MQVCHHCHNPGYPKPTHFFLGTNLDNQQDCIAKGRKHYAHGSATGGAKLTEGLVREIRQQYEYGSHINGLVALAKRYSVSQATIRAIVTRQHWNHVL